MKHAMFVLAIVVAAFIVGCQDNNITNPMAANLSSGNQRSKDVTLPIREIPLHGVMHEPSGYNAFTEINGQIAYTTTLISRDPIPPNPQWAVLVTLTVNADLMPWNSNGPVWGVSGSSRDEFALAEDADGAMVLEKSYTLIGRDDGVSLHLRFCISQETVVLSRMWLALPQADQKENGN